MLPPFVKDKRGLRTGRLLVAEFIEVRDRRSYWKCLCDCGAETVLMGSNFGKTKSCGCATVENCRLIGLQRPSGCAAPSGKTKDRLQKIYRGMIDRCTKRRNSAWADYGGRGITVSDEWMESFDAFYYWAVSNGYDNALTLDRVNNDMGYSAQNCRWVSYKVQANNRRSSVFYTAFGETKTFSMWLEDSRCIVSIPTIKSRLAKGWSFDLAISTAGMNKSECSKCRWDERHKTRLAS